MLSVSPRSYTGRGPGIIMDPNMYPISIRSLWIPLYHNFYFDSSPPTRPAPVMEMTRIAIRLRLWLRRAIKRINERTMERIVDMVNWNSLRALYTPIRIVELD